MFGLKLVSKETLNKYDEHLKTCEEEKIAIGTDKGGSFLYFGPPDAEMVKMAFELYRKTKYKRLISNYKKLEGILFTKPPFIKTQSDDEYCVDMKMMDRADIVRQLYNAIKDTEKWIKNSLDTFMALDREVLETYSKEIDDCTAVIISGREQGNYMLEREYVEVLKKILLEQSA